MGKGEGTTINVYGLYSAILMQDTAAGLLFGTNRYLTSVATASKETTTNPFQGWYNGERQEHLISEGGSKVTVAGKDLPGAYVAMLLGKYWNEADGLIYDMGDQADAPYMSCSYNEITVEGAIFHQFMKGKWTLSSKEAATKNDGGFDPKQITLVFEAINTVYKYALNSTNYKKFDVATDAWIAIPEGVTKPLKMLSKYVESADYDATKTAWYAAVQLPESASPDAIALASAVPADSDTGIAVDVAPLLTFNNAISSYSITLLEDSTNINQSATRDSTNKILTVQPGANLSAETEYSLVYDVTDVYGQRLQGAVIFGTA